MSSNYLTSAKKQFQYYKMLGDRTFEQLNDPDIHWKFNDNDNNISIIVKHMVGNMLSRWTNFLTEDGEKSWRERDLEFIDSYVSKSENRDCRRVIGIPFVESDPIHGLADFLVFEYLPRYPFQPGKNRQAVSTDNPVSLLAKSRHSFDFDSCHDLQEGIVIF